MASSGVNNSDSCLKIRNIQIIESDYKGQQKLRRTDKIHTSAMHILN